MLTQILLNTTSRKGLNQFQKNSNDCEKVQLELLRSILSFSQASMFGVLHDFSHTHTAMDFRKRVPVRDYEAFRPWIQRIMQGEKRVLTSQSVQFFNLTSGTTSEPKWIPTPAAEKKAGDELLRRWMLLTLKDNPSMLSGAQLAIPGPAIEGTSPAGIPYGSATGRAYRGMPFFIRKNYAVPDEVFQLKDYDLRYRLIMRFALERKVTAIATPNPMTLVRLARVAEEEGESLIRSIFDGNLGPLGYLGKLRVGKNPSRARALGLILERVGSICLTEAWPELAVIGCWLGGSVGSHAWKLPPIFGNTALRDLGYLASEGRMSMPFENHSTQGILATENCFFEFIPAHADLEFDNPYPINLSDTLLAHELEVGEEYRVIITNRGGLYRYDMNDIVRVTDFYGNTPIIEFLRKGKDVSNLVGEKIHVNQCISAFNSCKMMIQPSNDHFFLVPMSEKPGYTLVIEFDACPNRRKLQELALIYETSICNANVEYATKSKSQRLKPLQILPVAKGTMEQLVLDGFRNGVRDTQHKWRYFRENLPDLVARVSSK
jgi:hypothetical protein